MKLEFEFGLLDSDGGGSSSSVLSIDHEILRTSIGKESYYPNSQKFFKVELRIPMKAEFSFGEKFEDFEMLLGWATQDSETENITALQEYCISIIMKKLSDPEKMVDFITDIREDAFHAGWKEGRNDLRENFFSLMQKEH